MPGSTPHSNPQRRLVRFGDERFFTPMQIALRLGYKDDGAIGRAIHSGELAAFQTSERKVVVAESEIERWLVSKAVASGRGSETSSAAEPAPQSRPQRRRRTDMPLIGRTVVKK